MTEITKILGFFRDVETMEIPSAPRLAQGPFPVTEFTSLGMRQLPWQSRKPGLTKKEATFYLVCLGVHDMRPLVEQVVRAIAPEQEVDEEELQRLRGQGFLGTLLLDWHGRPVKGGFLPAPFVLGADRLANGKDLSDLADEVQTRADQIAEEHFGPAWPAKDDSAGKEAEGRSVTFDFEVHDKVMAAGPLIGISRGLAKRLGIPADIVKFRVMSRTVRRRRKSELSPPDFSETVTPSFFVDDLAAIAKKKELSAPLMSYLGPETAAEGRVDLLADSSAMGAFLAPERLSLGRWPSDPSHHLVLAQQAAVGAATDDGRPLVAVNGPPGTGKTTLLRDVIADAVTRRALRLCEVEDPMDIFVMTAGNNGSFPVVKSDLVAGTGILVTSNNNAAVENISSELPRRASIDARTFVDADYVGAVADDVARSFGAQAPESWGLLALKLGNKSNIEATLRGLDQPYRDGDEDPISVPPQGLYERLRGSAPPGDWESARKRFKQAWEDVAQEVKRRQVLGTGSGEEESEGQGQAQLDLGAFMELAPTLAEAPDEMLLPDSDYFSRSFADQHLSSVWVTPAFERLRSELFLAALRLHEVALRINAHELRRLVYPFKRVLSGQERVTAEQLVKVWNTLFFISPVISTTLASVRRMPLKLAWIGHVLVDESGQATPQSVVGALQRAAKATIVGDPLQIEPVFTVPSPVVEKMRVRQEIDRRFSPTSASAQTLADGVMGEGAWVSVGDGDRVWTGLPLRVHRRCSEPMFSVANAIAYDGQMVQASRGIPAFDADPGPSCWFDVQGKSAINKVVAEEMACLEQELGLLGNAWPQGGAGPASLFVISPFVSVAAEAQQIARKVFGKEAYDLCPTGTVHRFQGREADIVYLVLGSHPGAAGEGSRRWAAQKPNLLNVALTRARARVYVIGNFDDWSRQPYFSRLGQVLSLNGAVYRG